MSLFTFLDGLVCTMGALILVLIAMTHKASVEALTRQLQARATRTETAPLLSPAVVTPPLLAPEEPARVEPEPQPAPLDEEELAERRRRREAWLAKLAEIATERDRRRDAVRQEEESLSETEKKLRAAQAGLTELQSRLGLVQAEHRQFMDAERSLQEKQSQIGDQIALTQRNVELLKRKQANTPSKYAMIPFDGASGTTRRPIYIECTGKGLRILPEDEFLTAEDLEGFTEGFNPLLAGTRALVQYWTMKKRRGGDDEPDPYVLLLVRPSGSLAFYEARRFLTRLETPFGYELIDEDWKLNIPSAEPQAKAAAHQAIREALGARTDVADVLAGATPRSPEYGSSATRRYLPRGIGEGDPWGGGVGTGTGTEPRGRPQGSGGGQPGGNEPGGNGTFPGHQIRAGNRVVTPGSPGKSGGDAASSIGIHPGVAGSPGSNGAQGVAGGTGGSSGSATVEQNGLGNRGAVGATGNSTVKGAGIGTGGTAGKPGNPAARSAGAGKESDKTQFAPIGLGNGESSAQGEGRGGVAGADGEPPDIPSPFDSATREGVTGALGTKGRTAADGGRDGQPGDVPALRDIPRDLDASSSDSSPGSLAGRSVGTRGKGQAGSPASSSGPTAAGSRRSMPGGDSSSGGSSPGGSAGFGSSASGASDGAHPKKEWGYTRGRATIGLERKLEIHVLPDTLLIGPNDSTLPAGRGEKRDELVQQTVDAIERSAQGWGKPPANFYWIPAIKFVVYPGGNQHYERLHGPLLKWGLPSSVQYAIGDAPKKPLPGALK